MQKKYKIILSIIGIILVLLIALGIYIFFFKKDEEQPKIKNENNVVSKIDNYNYTLDDRDSKLMQDEFKKLNDILSASEIDYSAYAESLAKLFVIDLYTIDNKINKYDVGSLEYLFESEQEKFKTKVMDTLYELVEDDSYKTRDQELPQVSSINVVDNQLGQYDLKGSKIDAYIINLEWNYVKDLGYDNKATIYIVNQDNKLYVIEYIPSK